MQMRNIMVKAAPPDAEVDAILYDFAAMAGVKQWNSKIYSSSSTPSSFDFVDAEVFVAGTRPLRTNEEKA